MSDQSKTNRAKKFQSLYPTFHHFWRVLVLLASMSVATYVVFGNSLAKKTTGQQDTLQKNKLPAGSGLKSIAVVPNQEYESECASCHIGFLPGFLPERSWKLMMDTLDQHFGENAELDPEPKERILSYLKAHAADSKKATMRSKRIAKMIDKDDKPQRITNTPFWVRRHASIREWVFERPDVTSKAKCDSCHREAKSGVFDARDVTVPRDLWWQF